MAGAIPVSLDAGGGLLTPVPFDLTEAPPEEGQARPAKFVERPEAAPGERDRLFAELALREGRDIDRPRDVRPVNEVIISPPVPLAEPAVSLLPLLQSPALGPGRDPASPPSAPPPAQQRGGFGGASPGEPPANAPPAAPAAPAPAGPRRASPGALKATTSCRTER